MALVLSRGGGGGLTRKGYLFEAKSIKKGRDLTS